ncbi:type II toxin-antitoxin system RelE/ParE family toxin [Sphingorhabdus arenilitoris]|uniref:Toxin n=1 Tax=Sphingorhabdus arenilitoris TaxID=1490041 RepID=A0ABV8RJC3_9SPHN
MAKLVLTPKARNDLAAIDEWGYQQFGLNVADDYSRGLKQAFDQIADFPKSDAAASEIGKNIRCLTHRKHRIFYSYTNDTVLIVRIVHHAMDAKRAMN